MNSTSTLGNEPQLLTRHVHGDNRLEPDEEFSVNLSNNVNATAVKRVGAGIIKDDDRTQTCAVLVCV